MILDIKESDTVPVFWMCRTLPGFTWTTWTEQCWHCEKPTTWIDNSFGAHLHPGRCSEAKQDERAWTETFELIQEWRRGNGL